MNSYYVHQKIDPQNDGIAKMSNIWDAEIQISLEQAQICISAQFPELCPSAIAVLGKGFDNKEFYTCKIIRIKK